MLEGPGEGSSEGLSVDRHGGVRAEDEDDGVTVLGCRSGCRHDAVRAREVSLVGQAGELVSSKNGRGWFGVGFLNRIPRATLAIPYLQAGQVANDQAE
jgi:hypothetical protein